MKRGDISRIALQKDDASGPALAKIRTNVQAFIEKKGKHKMYATLQSRMKAKYPGPWTIVKEVIDDMAVDGSLKSAMQIYARSLLPREKPQPMEEDEQIDMRALIPKMYEAKGSSHGGTATVVNNFLNQGPMGLPDLVKNFAGDLHSLINFKKRMPNEVRDFVNKFTAERQDLFYSMSRPPPIYIDYDPEDEELLHFLKLYQIE